MCPSCGALVGINATRCHECGANLRFGLAAWSKGLAEFFGGHAPVTVAILIANVVMFAAELMGTMQAGGLGGLSILWGMNGEVLYRLGASDLRSLLSLHQWYRLITAMFLHGGLIHIGFNMMVFLDLGPIVEEVYGSARYLFLYVVTGAVSFVASALAGHFSIGASGYMRELRSRLISWVITIFAIGFLFGGLRTDHWAHAGGLTAGYVLGKVFVDRQPMNGSEKTRAYALGWIAGIVAIASFLFMVLNYRDAIPGWISGAQ